MSAKSDPAAGPRVTTTTQRVADGAVAVEIGGGRRAERQLVEGSAPDRGSRGDCTRPEAAEDVALPVDDDGIAAAHER